MSDSPATSIRSQQPPKPLGSAWTTFNGYWVFCQRDANGLPTPIVAVYRAAEVKSARCPQTRAKIRIQTKPPGWETLPNIEAIPAQATRARIAQEWAGMVEYEREQAAGRDSQGALEFAGASSDVVAQRPAGIDGNGGAP